MDNFETISTNKTILVDFYADWCGPCKLLSPIIDDIKSEFPEISVYKVNVDDNFDLAKEYGVMSIPTIIIFKDGTIKTKIRGLVSKEEIISNIK